MKLFALFTFIAVIFLTEGTLNSCPRERCVRLHQCPALSSAIRSRIPRLRQLAQRAICGYRGVHAKVCCEAPDRHGQRLVETPGHSRLRPAACQRDQHGNRSCHRSTNTRPQDARAPLPEACGLTVTGNRIFGGTHAELGSYPWIVAMKYTRSRDNATNVLCAGTLISNRYVVTAAHCLDKSTITGWELTSLLLGDWRLSTDPDCSSTACAPRAVEVRPELLLQHPDYNTRHRFSDDVALVRLARVVSFTTFVQPLCLPPFVLPPAEVALGMPVTALGWGQWEEGNTSDTLRRVTLDITSPLLCRRHYPDDFRVNRGQLCLGGSGGVDTCSGDSGGPVVMLGSSSGRSYLLGLPSFGRKVCGQEGVPAVYTSVAHYASWVRSALSP